jgi:hypothetical protein
MQYFPEMAITVIRRRGRQALGLRSRFSIRLGQVEQEVLLGMATLATLARV